MAKQRRPAPKSSKAPASAPPGRQAPPSIAHPSEPTQAPSGAPQRRTTYYEAVALYERGLEALQRHDFSDAAEILESVLRQYPDEKELHERVRLYLNICERQATPKEPTP